MKKNIHPTYTDKTVKCVACDKVYQIKSSANEMTITACSNCHPLYSGGLVEKKALGRIERFNKILNKKNK